MKAWAKVVGCALLASSSASCSAGNPAAASHPAPHQMPSGARWRGVYQGPYHIVLNIWTEGNRAKGNWRAVGDREGAFSGTVRGNLLVIDWTEREVEGRGSWAGRGYFVYQGGKPGHPDEIYGEWGEGRSGRASPWWALKRAGDPRGATTGQIDADADQQDQDTSPTSCDVGNCDNDTDVQ
jgi:hypothetical protein